MKKSITDKLVQKVEIKLDDKTWPLVMTHNVIIEAEEAIGPNANLLSGETSIIKPSFKTVRALLWASLRRAGSKLTLDEVGDLITPQNLVMIQQAVLTAWANTMPETEAVESPLAVAGT